MYPSFSILPKGEISNAFLERNITSFYEACLFIGDLPYGRNSNINRLVDLFEEQCGTCSTKHALLKLLAEENNFNGLRLILGMYKMNAINSPKLKVILEQNKLDYLPEAHCYLIYNNQIIDHTNNKSKLTDFSDDFLGEIEINVDEITDLKVTYHKNYLKDWLSKNQLIKYTLSEIWDIREQCIKSLSN